ncbi:unnamed protein product [Zymoseptoria tritici ST99CH_1A5]|uniref:Uncharacterized protein n=1 Tax=Zymoseptoria tritici ST99CH_1A5 TaxID=1276529 RepID=A0A1Y6M4L3_ZYMTR|nr:unnamed protein product [Zymoseptoria tritici ST99CH_1A5]
MSSSSSTRYVNDANNSTANNMRPTYSQSSSAGDSPPRLVQNTAIRSSPRIVHNPAQRVRSLRATFHNAEFRETRPPMPEPCRNGHHTCTAPMPSDVDDVPAPPVSMLHRGHPLRQATPKPTAVEVVQQQQQPTKNTLDDVKAFWSAARQNAEERTECDRKAKEAISHKFVGSRLNDTMDEREAWRAQTRERAEMGSFRAQQKRQERGEAWWEQGAGPAMVAGRSG